MNAERPAMIRRMRSSEHSRASAGAGSLAHRGVDREGAVVPHRDPDSSALITPDAHILRIKINDTNQLVKPR
jgi:hypothetical protein